MILGDGLIGQMMEPVEFPDHLKIEPTNKDDWATNGMDTRKSNNAIWLKRFIWIPRSSTRII